LILLLLFKLSNGSGIQRGRVAESAAMPGSVASYQQFSHSFLAWEFFDPVLNHRDRRHSLPGLLSNFIRILHHFFGSPSRERV